MSGLFAFDSIKALGFSVLLLKLPIILVYSAGKSPLTEDF